MQVLDIPFILQENEKTIVRIAEDEAEKKGHFKYGVKVESGQTGEMLYDEDPTLIVT
ncbi:MAG: hypothetical protein P4L41_00605 [Flavipsychrobacter sp.]|nr:hypothetical protein [Flavipsychrobacter sp.]